MCVVNTRRQHWPQQTRANLRRQKLSFSDGITLRRDRGRVFSLLIQLWATSRRCETEHFHGIPCMVKREIGTFPLPRLRGTSFVADRRWTNGKFVIEMLSYGKRVFVYVGQVEVHKWIINSIPRTRVAYTCVTFRSECLQGFSFEGFSRKIANCRPDVLVSLLLRRTLSFAFAELHLAVIVTVNIT